MSRDLISLSESINVSHSSTSLKIQYFFVQESSHCPLSCRETKKNKLPSQPLKVRGARKKCQVNGCKIILNSVLNHEIQNMSSGDDLLYPEMLTTTQQDLLGKILLSTYYMPGAIQVLDLQQQFSGAQWYSDL